MGKLITSLVFFVVLLSTACSQPLEWDEIRSKDVAWVSSEWGKPELVSLSTPGWEEGIYISKDGQTLFYIYTTIDVFKYIYGEKLNVVNPPLDSGKQCTHPLMPTPHTCGQWPRADHFYSVKEQDGWSTPKPHPLTLDGPIGGLTFVGDSKAYFMSGFEDEVEDIGYAVFQNGQWGEKQKISSLSLPEYASSDPWVSEDDSEMFFWSRRPDDLYGKANIYRSVKVNDTWQEPEILSSPINSDGEEMQPFLFEDYLYFAAEREGHLLAIYKSKRLGENTWGQLELVIASEFAVGEPSITADGRYLYFEQIFTDGKGNYNPEIMVVKK